MSRHERIDRATRVIRTFDEANYSDQVLAPSGVKLSEYLAHSEEFKDSIAGITAMIIQEGEREDYDAAYLWAVLLVQVGYRLAQVEQIEEEWA